MAHSSVSPAPWRSAFLDHVKQMDSPTFTLSTLHAVRSSLSPEPSLTPRSRTVVYRGLWGSLPTNPKNPAELNPDVYESDILTITTDARMEKMPDFYTTEADMTTQSGGGGPVEGTFWIVETRTQWRLRGKAYVLGPDISSDEAAPVRKAIERYMRSNGNTDGWSWAREVTAHFGNLSPGMRGSFRQPPSGAPKSDKVDEGLGLGQKVDDLDDEIARKHFRVVVILPHEVDRVDFNDPDKAQRWNYKLEGDGSWKTTELWP